MHTHTNRNTNSPMFMNLTWVILINKKSVNETDYIFEIKLCGEKKTASVFFFVSCDTSPLMTDCA